MEKIKETLITLLPLLLILVVSWLFSLMGSKLKGKQDSEEQPVQKNTEEQQPDLMQILTGTKEKAPEVPSAFHDIDGGAAFGKPQHRPVAKGGPVITPKPITPKWWGA